MSRRRRASLRQNEKEIGQARGPNGHRLCRWCKKEVQPPRKTFCGESCLHEWKLRSDVHYLRKYVYERDLGICAQCNLDTRYVRIELENAARDSMKESGRWFWEDHQIFLEVAAKYKLTVKETRKSIWQADHINPVAKGGGLADLSNIQTLCLPCHKIKTRAQFKKIKITPR